MVSSFFQSKMFVLTDLEEGKDHFSLFQTEILFGLHMEQGRGESVSTSRSDYPYYKKRKCLCCCSLSCCCSRLLLLVIAATSAVLAAVVAFIYTLANSYQKTYQCIHSPTLSCIIQSHKQSKIPSHALIDMQLEIIQ